MQVDDKLAKEKLIRELEALRPRPILLMGKVEGYVNGIIESIELIRNTDLTDCQPQTEQFTPTHTRNDYPFQKLGNVTIKDRATGNWISGVLYRSESGELSAYDQSDFAADFHAIEIAPAPDQGSVRNATDMRERCARVADLAASDNKKTALMADDIIEKAVFAGAVKQAQKLAAAIRALPVLEAAKE